jgi:hypothetical protein
LVAVSPVAVYSARPLASARIGPNLELLTLTTVEPVGVDAALEEKIVVGGAVDA